MSALVGARVALLPCDEADLGELHGLFTDPDVRGHLLDGDVVTEEWVGAEIAGSRRRFARIGCGLWCVREIGAETIVGITGFRPFFEPPELQLLYGFLPAYQGRGLATEAAEVALRHYFGELRRDEARAATDAPNRASIRVLERLGFEEWDRTPDPPAGTVFFRLSRAAWGARRGA